MTIFVLGGDGFCGWPTALHLSYHGYKVVIVDNFERRKIDLELGTHSLTPIQTLETRLEAWRDVTGKVIRHYNINIAKEYDKLLEMVKTERPTAIVHFAEQRAAPYSMKDSAHKTYTIQNNLGATTNVLNAIVDSGLDIHLIHLGTMGVYGYNTTGLELPEGYLDVTAHDKHGNKSNTQILYPPCPGSVYHTTKCQDALLFDFYNRNNKIRVTDLHQGIVWGTQTEETKLDERLINRFDYDGDFGTVLNRFIMQGVLGYPLTVYGTGGQTRAFIHLQNTVQCIRLAIEHPPDIDRVQIFNQTTETHRLIDLAQMIRDLTGTDIQYLDNPRKEKIENELKVCHDQFLALGLNPITLEEGLVKEVQEIVKKYKDTVQLDKIMPSSKW